MNDSFSFQLIIFHDICIKAGLHQDFRLTTFSIMLKNLVLGYYYSNISIRNFMNFDQACYAISTYFESAEYKRVRLNKQNALTLRSIVNQNENKSLNKYFETLIIELRNLQHGLNLSLQTDAFIHNKLITACQKINACRFACYSLVDTVSDLINDLRSSITIFKKTHKFETYFIHIRYFEGRSRSSYLSKPFVSYNREKILKYDSRKNSFDENMKTLMIERPSESERKSRMK